MVTTPQILHATVMHQRLFPKKNQFQYGVYYLVLPLPTPPIGNWMVGFSAKDLGDRTGKDPTEWAMNLLKTAHLDTHITQLTLLTMPRVLGYVFNPVSFYLGTDSTHQLRVVLCEVHNTFGEQHTYICSHADGSPIHANQWLEAQKVFHVSPFLTREGSYRFRFDIQLPKVGIFIDYYDPQANQQLITSMVGRTVPFSRHQLRVAFWRHPLVTLKAIAMIHWQAIRLLVKGVKYHPKPTQTHPTVTITDPHLQPTGDTTC